MKNQLFLSNFILIFGLFVTWPVFSQLTISGEVRPRSELRHGFKALASKNQDAAFFIDQRTRINLDFKTDDIETYVSFQDVRVWGNTQQLVANAGALTSVHQAWAKVKFQKHWAMKLGRQEISYDDHRILGNVGWAQQARSHDAALVTFEDSTFQAHLGLAFNQESPRLTSTIYTLPNNYKTLQYIWLHKKWAAIKASFLLLNNGLQVVVNSEDFRTNFSQTAGGRLSWGKGKTGINLAAYYQGGTDGDAADTKINAYFIGLDLAYQVKQHTRLIAGVEILSGNDADDNNGKNNAFNPFYGTNHKFNGLMDYFYVGNHRGSVGLNDAFLKVNYKKSSFNTGLAVHFLMSNGNLVDPSGASLSTYLGTEVDWTLGFNLTKGASMKMGYSQMFGTDSMVQIRGGDTDAISNWVWAMVTIKPAHTFKKG